MLCSIPWLLLLLSLFFYNKMDIKQIRTIVFFLTLSPLIFTPKKFLKKIGNKIKGISPLISEEILSQQQLSQQQLQQQL